MKRFLTLMTLSIALASCSQSGNENKEDLINSVSLQKRQIDQKINNKTLQVWVRVKNQNKAILVENRRYPKNIDITYNIFKDEKGRMRYAAEMPTSPDNDWFIAYKSYFDTTGNIIAFQRINNFMNSGCVRGAAMESMTKLYDHTFNAIDSTYTLTDTYKKPLEKSACKFPYNFPFKITKSSKDYLLDNNLAL